MVRLDLESPGGESKHDMTRQAESVLIWVITAVTGEVNSQGGLEVQVVPELQGRRGHPGEGCNTSFTSTFNSLCFTMTSGFYARTDLLCLFKEQKQNSKQIRICRKREEKKEEKKKKKKLTSCPGLPGCPGGPDGPRSPWRKKEKEEVRKRRSENLAAAGRLKQQAAG